MPLLFKKKKLELEDYLCEPRNVAFIEGNDPLSAINKLIELAIKDESTISREVIFEAIQKREEIISTGIGVGIALPHAKVDDIDDFYIALGIHKGEGIVWNSIDKEPVKIIFLIIGPSSKPKEYLQILSKITTILRNNEKREELVWSRSVEEVVNILERC